MKQHHTWVKFTGTAHRAHCRDCPQWSGMNHSMIKEMGQGRSQNTAWYRTKSLAEQDGRDHRRREQLKERRTEHEQD